MKQNKIVYMLNLSNRLNDLVGIWALSCLIRLKTATQQHNLKGEVTRIQVNSMIKADQTDITVTVFDKENNNVSVCFYDFLTEEELDQKLLIVEIALTTNESPSLKDFR